MHPEFPSPPDDGAGDGAEQVWVSAGDVGEFRQGTELSRWALARYLVGRSLLAAVSNSLLALFLLLVVIGCLLEWGAHLTFLAVLVFVVAVMVLLLLLALRAVLRRVMAAERVEVFDDRLTALVRDTRRDVRRELGRVGLPHTVLTLPLVAFRLIGRRRAETMERMRAFDVDRAVPKARLDELHMLLRAITDRSR